MAAGGCLGDDVVEHGNATGWEGGAGYYKKWPAGPPSEPSYSPLGVWMQNPANAAAYKAIGINLFVGLWEGPTERQLGDLEAAGASSVCGQNATGLAQPVDGTIVAWDQDGESPDNAQLQPDQSYGPCIEPGLVQSSYASMVARDATRPVHLHLGQGVANDKWEGRGSACSGRLDMYPEYIKGGDIISFHVYPVNSTDVLFGGKLWSVASGVDRLRAWSRYTKPVWPFIETTPISDPARHPTPAQIKAEVWMAIVHGASGIVYFVHVQGPKFIEAGLLADPVNKAAVAAINKQIQTLAPVLNTPPLSGTATVTSSDTRVPVDALVKRSGKSLFVFTVAMRDGTVTATISVRGMSTGTAEALGEGRRIPIVDGRFQDSYSAYAVHLYEITSP